MPKKKKVKRKKKATTRKKTPKKKPSKKKEEFYINLNAPKELRRDVLYTAMETAKVLKSYERLAQVRKNKKDTLEKLYRTMREVSKLVTKLKRGGLPLYKEILAEIEMDEFKLRSAWEDANQKLEQKDVEPVAAVERVQPETNELDEDLKDIKLRLIERYKTANNNWFTDQVDLYDAVNKWNKITDDFIILKDEDTKFKRLDRGDMSSTTMATDIKNGLYTDYHCLRPYDDYIKENENIYNLLGNRNMVKFVIYLVVAVLLFGLINKLKMLKFN